MLSEHALQSILEQAWTDNDDPSHDMGHVRRVVKMAKDIAVQENANLEIVLPSAWLHDVINIQKDHPDRSRASTLSANYAVDVLRPHGYTNDYLDAIHHTIAAHSFSAKITPKTLEAKVLQDADRLDSLGPIGIARVFAISGSLGRSLFHAYDPLAENRELDDSAYAVDHFYEKLLKLVDMMHTDQGRTIAIQRTQFMHDFLCQLAKDASI